MQVNSFVVALSMDPRPRITGLLAARPKRDDKLRVAQHRNVRVMSGHDHLPALFGPAQASHEGLVDKLAVQVVLGLVITSGSLLFEKSRTESSTDCCWPRESLEESRRWYCFLPSAPSISLITMISGWSSNRQRSIECWTGSWLSRAARPESERTHLLN